MTNAKNMAFFHTAHSDDGDPKPLMALLSMIEDGTADATVWNAYINWNRSRRLTSNRIAIAIRHAPHFHIDLATGEWVEWWVE